MGICQIIMLVLACMSLGVSMARNGHPKTGTHNFGIDLIAWVLQLGLLYFGGFFS